MVHCLDGRLAGDGFFEHILGFALRIGIQSEDLAQVGLAQRGEHHAIHLGPAVGVFVGKHTALAERRQPHPRHEAAPGVGAALVLILLVIDVAGVAVVGGIVVARLDAIEDQAHDVAGMAPVEPVLQLRIDHVVGRRHHVAERADLAEIVANRTKSLDFGHSVVAGGRNTEACRRAGAGRWSAGRMTDEPRAQYR